MMPWGLRGWGLGRGPVPGGFGCRARKSSVSARTLISTLASEPVGRRVQTAPFYGPVAESERANLRERAWRARDGRRHVMHARGRGATPRPGPGY